MSTTISSAFGYAGVVANLIWPTLTRRTHLLMGQVIACGLMLTHFALLNAHSGAWIMGTAGLQALLAIPLGQSPRFKILYLLSLPLTPLISALTWQGPQSIFFIIGVGFSVRGQLSVVTTSAKAMAHHSHLRLDHAQPAHRINSRISLQHIRSWHQHLDAEQDLEVTARKNQSLGCCQTGQTRQPRQTQRRIGRCACTGSQCS